MFRFSRKMLAVLAAILDVPLLRCDMPTSPEYGGTEVRGKQSASSFWRRGTSNFTPPRGQHLLKLAKRSPMTRTIEHEWRDARELLLQLQHPPALDE